MLLQPCLMLLSMTKMESNKVYFTVTFKRKSVYIITKCLVNISKVAPQNQWFWLKTIPNPEGTVIKMEQFKTPDEYGFNIKNKTVGDPQNKKPWATATLNVWWYCNNHTFLVYCAATIRSEFMIFSQFKGPVNKIYSLL